ncbi:MAG: 50S ribosomal protein L15 [Candidatus Dojkabacteria bacterium]
MLNNLPKIKTRKSKRIGRGYGSAKGGHTVGRGQKGQKSRSGYKPARRGFEGGAMPLSRRIPKLKGFRRGYFMARVNPTVVNVGDLNEMYASGETIDISSLIEKGVIRSRSKTNSIKILAKGKITKKLTVDGIPVSENAKKMIEAKGGSIKTLSAKQT